MLTKSRTISLLVFVLLASLVPAYESDAVAQQNSNLKDAVVFCVSSAGVPGAIVMEPVLSIEGRKYVNPIAGDSDLSVLKEFEKKYYSRGQKYRLLFGGGDAGFVAVQKSNMESECSHTQASIKFSGQTSVKLNRNVMALATNSSELGRGQSSRRPPVPGERTEALRLAKLAFGAKGVSKDLLSTLEVVNLTAMDLNGVLVGTFVLKQTKGGPARHVLFLIAEPQGEIYRSTLTNYQRYTNKDIMSGGSLESIGSEGIYTERLVDQLDLDLDGTNELMTITNGFESVTYTIYKKRSDSWKSIYEFASYRCAF